MRQNEAGRGAGIFDSQDSQRFYISIQWYQKFSFSYQVIVVSKTSDPRDGFNGVFAVDTSATEPSLGFQNCIQNGGCLGDYPSYGMDSAAFWSAPLGLSSHCRDQRQKNC